MLSKKGFSNDVTFFPLNTFLKTKDGYNLPLKLRVGGNFRELVFFEFVGYGMSVSSEEWLRK